MRIYGVIILIVIGLFGCAPVKRITRGPLLSFDELQKQLQNRRENIHSLYAEGNITIESPEFSNSGSFKLNLKKPDSLRIDVKGPFGVRIATFSLTKDKAVFYDWMNNTVSISSPDGSALNSILQTPLSFDDIILMLTGDFQMKNLSDSLLSFSSNKDNYILKYISSTNEKEILIDRNSFITTHFKFSNKGAPTSFSVDATDIEETNETTIPMFIRLISSDQSRSITINYDDININTDVDCAFTIPKQARVVYR